MGGGEGVVEITAVITPRIEWVECGVYCDVSVLVVSAG